MVHNYFSINRRHLFTPDERWKKSCRIWSLYHNQVGWTQVFFFLTYEKIYSKELGYKIWDFARQFQKPKVRLLGKGRELNSQHSTSYFSDGIWAYFLLGFIMFVNLFTQIIKDHLPKTNWSGNLIVSIKYIHPSNKPFVWIVEYVSLVKLTHRNATYLMCVCCLSVLNNEDLCGHVKLSYLVSLMPVHSVLS